MQSVSPAAGMSCSRGADTWQPSSGRLTPATGERLSQGLPGGPRAPKMAFTGLESVRKRGSTPLKKPPRTRQTATLATMLLEGSSITLITYPSPLVYHTTPSETARAHPHTAAVSLFIPPHSQPPAAVQLVPPSAAC